MACNVPARGWSRRPKCWPAAQVTRVAQNERYRAGVASLLDLLDAEGVEQNARRQHIESLRDHRLARVRLLAICGQLERLAP